jgi:hypothetical protein
MAFDRRRLAIVGGVLAVLAAVAVYRVWPRPSAAAAGAAARGRAARVAEKPSATEVPDVRLDTLTAERPEPGSDERNLFRFRVKVPPPPPPSAARAAPTGGNQMPAVPSGPPPRPPIALKFIGIVEAPGQGPKIAVLSDGRNVFHGREGDIIEGRYRVIRIGAESVELAYADGGGRQMIRLTGS